jgi:ribonucleoside-diphosphate reductase alpha chain
MDIYDKMCFTVSSAGGRRGAQMGTFDVGHPDVMEFIRAKREDGRLRQFNLSLLITDEFMQAVRNDEATGRWRSRSCRMSREAEGRSTWTIRRRSSGATGRSRDGYVTRRCAAASPAASTRRAGAAAVGPDHGVHLRLRRAGLRAHRPRQRDEQQLVLREHPRHQSLRRAAAAALWRLPARLGQPHRFVAIRSPSAPQFDWENFREVVRMFTRMLDNVVEINGLPLAAQRHEIMRKRRHGMGFLGLGSALTMLCMKYGDERSRRIHRDGGARAGRGRLAEALELAREKGPAPIMDEEFRGHREMLRQAPGDGGRRLPVGDTGQGRVLHARYSRYMQRIAEVEPELVENSASRARASRTTARSRRPARSPCRWPTTPATASSPASRTITSATSSARAQDQGKGRGVLLRTAGLPRAGRPGAMPLARTMAKKRLPDYFVTADDITPTAHVDIQAAAQKWIDSSISKTANVPTDFPTRSSRTSTCMPTRRG